MKINSERDFQFSALKGETRIEFYSRWQKYSKKYFRWQFEQFEAYLGRRIADIGCGIGNFTDFFLNKELYLGVDSDQQIIDLVKNRYAGKKNINFITADINENELIPKLKEYGIDTIFCINLLEHIENDIQIMKNLLEIIPKDGTLCLFVPALNFNFGTLDILDGHYRRYDKRSLLDILDKSKVDILKMYYLNAIGALVWFIKGRVLRQKKHGSDNFFLMNLLVPIISKIEKFIFVPFGLSLVVILKKK